MHVWFLLDQQVITRGESDVAHFSTRIRRYTGQFKVRIGVDSTFTFAFAVRGNFWLLNLCLRSNQSLSGLRAGLL